MIAAEDPLTSKSKQEKLTALPNKVEDGGNKNK